MNDGETLIYLITRLIDRTNRMATARQAAIHLARSHWDVELAITNYVNPTAYISSEETSDSDDDEVYDPEPAREDIVDDDPDDTEVCHPEKLDIILADPVLSWLDPDRSADQRTY